MGDADRAKNKPLPIPPDELAAVRSRIARLRTAKGFTQEALATAAGMSHAAVSNIESGHTVPALGTLYAIAAVLGCSVCDIVGKKVQRPRKKPKE
jgi:transcriptional regulator with XRE-family HTH domain